MEDGIINWHKRKFLCIRWIGVAAILISLFFLQINFSTYLKTEDESANVRKEELLSEDDTHLFTEEQTVLLTELEKIQADLKIHP